MYVYARECVNVGIMYLRRSEDDLPELVLSLYHIEESLAVSAVLHATA